MPNLQSYADFPHRNHEINTSTDQRQQSHAKLTYTHTQKEEKWSTLQSKCIYSSPQPNITKVAEDGLKYNSMITYGIGTHKRFPTAIFMA